MTAESSHPDSGEDASPSHPPHFADRMIAEVVCHLEQNGAVPIDDQDAAAHARAIDGPLERRIIMRARRLADASLHDAVRSVNTTLSWMTLLLMVLGMLLGIATVRTTLAAGGDGRVNIVIALGSVLGVQTILLLVWLGAMIFAHRRAGRNQPTSPRFSLGAIVLAVNTWLSRRLHACANHLAAVEALGRVYAGGSIGRWGLSAITHGFWTVFNVGCLVTLLYMLSTRHYVFVWETTILNERQYIMLTRGISAVPQALGIQTPTEEQIAASRWTGDPLPLEAQQASEAWSSFFAGSIVVYGFGPRVLLLGLSLSLFRRSRKQYRLDCERPGFARLAPMLESHPSPSTTPKSISDAEVQPTFPQHNAHPPRPAGNPAIIGIELDPPKTGWPPTLSNASIDDLGIIETGEQQHALIERLRNAEREPNPLMIACSLTTTPDRGIAHTLHNIVNCVSRPVMLLLTGGQSLRDRLRNPESFRQRIADWKRLAAGAGIVSEDVHDLDLDHLTEASEQRLAAVAKRKDRADLAMSSSRLSDACAIIVRYAEEWLGQSSAAPTIEQQHDLQCEIAQLYAGRPQHDWPHLSQTMEMLRQNPEQALRRAADRMSAIMPDRLRASARWAAAGAMAGALGCIAASLTFTPLAASALPAWSMLGGAIAGLWKAAAQGLGANDTGLATDASPALTDAIRAAALNAVVLDLQGRDETTITRLLDAAFTLDEPNHLATANDVRNWLSRVQSRLRRASGAEGSL